MPEVVVVVGVLLMQLEVPAVQVVAEPVGQILQAPAVLLTPGVVVAVQEHLVQQALLKKAEATVVLVL
jgi:hypothetical protein